MRNFKSALIVIALLVAGCERANEPDAEGEVRSETRQLDTFDSVDMRGDAKIEITVGADAAITLEGRAEVLPRITTEVRGNTLYVHSKRRDWLWTEGDPRVRLRIGVPHLKSLSLRGGNDVQLSGFTGGESSVKVEGAASIKAQGYVDKLAIQVAGASHADFSKLEASDAKVTVDGVGSVFVNAKQSLNAVMNGVGAIYYSGNPHAVNTSMKGFGTIAQKDGEKSERERGLEPEIDPEKLQPEYDKKSVEEQLRDIEPTEAI